MTRKSGINTGCLNRIDTIESIKNIDYVLKF